MNSLKDSFYTLSQMTKRNIKIFLKDKAAVFFSLLAPLIVLLLYVLFLSDLQLNNINYYIPEGFSVSKNIAAAYVDSWMVAGVVSVACITVSLGANSVMIADKSKKIINDSMSSPVKKWVVTASYFLYNYIITVIITLIVFGICLVYLLINKRFFMSGIDILLIIGNVFLSAASSTLMTIFICGFFNTEATLSAFNGIISAMIGFLIGAYMPMSIMPKYVQYTTSIIPGSHSAGIFRNLMMRGSQNKLADFLPKESIKGLSEAFVLKINLFGKDVGMDIMLIFLCVSIIFFASLNIVFAYVRKKNKN